MSPYHYSAFWPRNRNAHIPHGNRDAHCHHPCHLSVALKQPPHAAQIHSIFLSASDGESTRKRPHRPRRSQLPECWKPKKNKSKRIMTRKQIPRGEGCKKGQIRGGKGRRKTAVSSVLFLVSLRLGPHCATQRGCKIPLQQCSDTREGGGKAWRNHLWKAWSELATREQARSMTAFPVKLSPL